MNLLDMLRQRREEQAQRLANLSASLTLPQLEAPRNVGFAPGMMQPRPAPMPPERPAPMAAPQTAMPIQGPLMDEMKVRGFNIDAPTFGSAQEYADKFAGGDLSKVKARTIMVDGAPVNDFYTRGLLDGPMPTEPIAPDASSGGFGPPQADFWDRLRMSVGGLFGG